MAIISEQYKQLKKNYEEAKVRVIAEARTALNKCVSDIFEQLPDLRSFGWTQYSSHHSNGEYSSFSVNTYGVYINGACVDYGEDFTKGEELSDERYEEIRKTLIAFLTNIDEEILLYMYGDHVKVTVNRDGSTKTSKY